MAFGTRRFLDVLRERHAASQAQQQIKTEAASFRSWGRNWPAARQLQQETGLTPGDLNPVGFSYQRSRFGRPNIRPSNAIPTLARAAERGWIPPVLKEPLRRQKALRNKALVDLSALNLDEDDQVALRAISDAARPERVTAGEFLDYIRGAERIPDETDNPNILTPEGRTAQQAQRLMGQYREMQQRAAEGQGGLEEFTTGNARNI